METGVTDTMSAGALTADTHCSLHSDDVDVCPSIHCELRRDEESQSFYWLHSIDEALFEDIVLTERNRALPPGAP